MRIPRIYESVAPLSLNSTITLDENGSGHVSRVLRLKSGDSIRLFDGKGHEFLATLEQVGKKTTAVLTEQLSHYVESPLKLELLQVISRGDRMDFTIQKAVELGVSHIVPLLSERCGVKLDAARAAKKQEYYQNIAIAACEQCGRNVIPTIHPVISLTEYIKQLTDTSTPENEGFLNLMLDPRAEVKLSSLPNTGRFRILIGPEGGFSAEEVSAMSSGVFQTISLGPRILRTETTALVALSILGSHFGDL